MTNTYHLWASNTVSWRDTLESHWSPMRERMSEQTVALCLQDTTERGLNGQKINGPHIDWQGPTLSGRWPYSCRWPDILPIRCAPREFFDRDVKLYLDPDALNRCESDLVWAATHHYRRQVNSGPTGFGEPECLTNPNGLSGI